VTETPPSQRQVRLPLPDEQEADALENQPEIDSKETVIDNN
jgi:hypothetical protein